MDRKYCIKRKGESTLPKLDSPVIPPSWDPNHSLVFPGNRSPVGTFFTVKSTVCFYSLSTNQAPTSFVSGTILTLCSGAIPKPSVKFYPQLLGITVSRTVLYTMKPVKVSRHIGINCSPDGTRTRDLY